MIKIEASAPLPMKKGQFEFSVISGAEDGKEHLIISKGLDISKILKDEGPIIVRIHSECITGDLFGSQRCDCGAQLDASLELIEKSGKGILIYLRQEGRGIGLVKKIKAYNLQDGGLDTVEANEKLGLRADARDYKIAADILKLIGIKSIDLISNNPQKKSDLETYGIKVEKFISLKSKLSKWNKGYLETKVKKMGHEMVI